MAKNTELLRKDMSNPLKTVISTGESFQDHTTSGVKPKIVTVQKPSKTEAGKTKGVNWLQITPYEHSTERRYAATYYAYVSGAIAKYLLNLIGKSHLTPKYRLVASHTPSIITKEINLAPFFDFGAKKIDLRLLQASGIDRKSFVLSILLHATLRNTDRHMGNLGFNQDTGEVLSFDYDKALQLAPRHSYRPHERNRILHHGATIKDFLRHLCVEYQIDPAIVFEGGVLTEIAKDLHTAFQKGKGIFNTKDSNYKKTLKGLAEQITLAEDHFRQSIRHLKHHHQDSIRGIIAQHTFLTQDPNVLTQISKLIREELILSIQQISELAEEKYPTYKFTHLKYNQVHFAIAKNSPETERIIEKASNKDLLAKDYQGRNSLNMALQYNNIKAALAIIAKLREKELSSICNEDILYAAMYLEDTNVFNLLLPYYINNKTTPHQLVEMVLTILEESSIPENYLDCLAKHPAYQQQLKAVAPQDTHYDICLLALVSIENAELFSRIFRYVSSNTKLSDTHIQSLLEHASMLAEGAVMIRTIRSQGYLTTEIIDYIIEQNLHLEMIKNFDLKGCYKAMQLIFTEDQHKQAVISKKQDLLLAAQQRGQYVDKNNKKQLDQHLDLVRYIAGSFSELMTDEQKEENLRYAITQGHPFAAIYFMLSCGYNFNRLSMDVTAQRLEDECKNAKYPALSIFVTQFEAFYEYLKALPR